MEMKVEIPNFEKILVKFEDIPGQAKDNVLIELVNIANDLKNEMITSMENSPATGRKYKHGVGYHTASSPYNPPRRMDGGLIGGFELDIDSVHLSVEVGNIIKDPDYPRYLEEGTPRMLPRPYIQPAIDNMEYNMKSRIMNAIRNSVRGA